MKRLYSIISLIAVLSGLPMSVFALDVKESGGDYYDHEETSVTIPYRLIVPEIYDDQYKFPLVLFFHGAGERGYENERQLEHCVQQIADNMPKAFILVPQCKHNKQWVNTPWGNGSYSSENVPESDEMMAVMDLVTKIMNEYSIDRDCVYAAGISMGGYAVWDAMVRHNDIFAAGVAVCGAGDPSKAEKIKDIPMFVFHGTADATVPVSGSQDMVNAIKSVGGEKVYYTEYEGSGHGIWGTVFDQKELYQQLNKCKLSDRIGIQDSLKKIFINPYVCAGAGAFALAIIATILLVIAKKK